MARTKKPENKIITYGCKKSAIAVAVCTSDASGAASIRVNGVPLKLVGPPILRTKILEPILLLGLSPFKKVKIRIRVRGGGQTSQIYAIRQAICKALIAYEQKYGDELTWLDMRQKLLAYDKTLLIADPRTREPKKFGGHGARARIAKSYR